MNVTVATFCMGLTIGDEILAGAGLLLSDGICVLLAIRLGSVIVGLILPLAAIGSFTACILM